MTDRILHDIGSGVWILSLTISDFWKSQGDGFELFRFRIHKQVTNEKKADRLDHLEQPYTMELTVETNQPESFDDASNSG